VIIPLSVQRVDESGQQQSLRATIRQAKSGHREPRPRKLEDEDMIDLTAPERGHP
jgi:hypothetical protein